MLKKKLLFCWSNNSKSASENVIYFYFSKKISSFLAFCYFRQTQPNIIRKPSDLNTELKLVD